MRNCPGLSSAASSCGRVEEWDPAYEVMVGGTERPAFMSYPRCESCPSQGRDPRLRGGPAKQGYGWAFHSPELSFMTAFLSLSV